MSQQDLTDIEILVLCTLWKRVGGSYGEKPGNVRFETIYKPIKSLGLSKRDVRNALKNLIEKQLARPYEKRKSKKGTYTLTKQGAILASKICAASWDEIRDRIRHK